MTIPRALSSSKVLPALTVLFGSLTVASTIVLLSSTTLQPFSILVLALICLFSAPMLGGGVSSVLGLLDQFRWFHWLWIMSFMSALVFRVRDVSSIYESPVDAWALYRIVLMAFIGMALVAHYAKNQANSFATLSKGLIGTLAAYAAVNLISTVWSVYPLWTLYKSLEYLIDVALIAAIVASLRRPEQLRSLLSLTWLLIGCLLASVWIGAAIWPREAFLTGVGLLDLQLQGVLPTVSANAVGEYGAILVAAAYARLITGTSRRGLYSGALIMGLATLIFSQTRSALLGLALAIPLLLLSARRYRALAIAVSSFLILAMTTNLDTLFYEFFLRGQHPKLFASLTGRVDWWRFGWEIYLEQPLIGYGAYAGGRFAVLAAYGSTVASHIHNAWLEVLFGTGLIGVLPISLLFIWLWRTILMSGTESSSLNALRVEAIGILAILSVRSLFNSGLIWHPSLEFMVVLGIAEIIRTKRWEGIPLVKGRATETSSAGG